MRQIILQSMSLVNFKGVRSLDIEFDPRQTTLCGENGTGKTTVFDAFCWCLFGKDSADRSDSNFNLKTLDEEGKAVLRQEHGVTCVLSVDGGAVKLQRRYCEVWTKPRGTTEETLTGHKTEFYVNDVRQGTKKDYDAVVGAMIPEAVFKMITNPHCFASLRPEAQKDMLLDMAGDVTDEDVASQRSEFAEVLSRMQGRPLATFRKEIAARKRAVKDELAVIPASMETARRLRPEAEDWKTLEGELEERRGRLADIDGQIADGCKRSEAETRRRLDIQKAINDRELGLSMREGQIRSEAEKEVSEARSSLQAMSYEVSSKRMRLQGMRDKAALYEGQLADVEGRLAAKRRQYHDENARRLVFPDGAFVCPTCGRPLEPEDAESKRTELTQNFNEAKSIALKNIQGEGKKLAAKADEIRSELSALTAEIASESEALSALEAEFEEKGRDMPAAPDAQPMIDADSYCVSLRNEIADLRNQLDMEAEPVDLTELKAAKASLSAEIDGLVRRLSVRDQIDRADKEIRDLDAKRAAASQTLADLEGLEFTATEFQKAKDAELLRRVNGMFSLVSFSFVDSQLNGGEKLTCVCSVDGVPYPDVNNAGKINAGLDIINAICRSKGISAPIFIDNREGVNRLLPTVSQVINLCVSADRELVVK